MACNATLQILFEESKSWWEKKICPRNVHQRRRLYMGQQTCQRISPTCNHLFFAFNIKMLPELRV